MKKHFIASLTAMLTDGITISARIHLTAVYHRRKLHKQHMAITILLDQNTNRRCSGKKPTKPFFYLNHSLAQEKMLAISIILPQKANANTFLLILLTASELFVSVKLQVVSVKLQAPWNRGKFGGTFSVASFFPCFLHFIIYYVCRFLSTISEKTFTKLKAKLRQNYSEIKVAF